jgi:molybdopterin converting factor subunit 1
MVKFVFMTINVLLFGITVDIAGKRRMALEVEEGCNVLQLRRSLQEMYPELVSLRSLTLAVNNEYAPDTHTLGSGDEVAVIPPVSGG